MLHNEARGAYTGRLLLFGHWNLGDYNGRAMWPGRGDTNAHTILLRKPHGKTDQAGTSK
jgi:hypothetical protein